jgi:hypothetical protein
MNTKDHALDLALEALEESVDLVREDYENAKKLYSNYPSRQARLLGLEDGLSKHEAAITAIKQARSAPYVASPRVQEPVAWTVSGKITDWSKDFSAYQTKHYTRPVYTQPAAPVQGQAAFNAGVPLLYPEMTDGETISVEYTTPPGGRQSEDCPTAAHRPVAEPHKWVHATEWRGLTDEDKLHIELMGGKSDVMLAEMVEAKLKAKNFA